ncbi:N-methyl-L-tryptophan oxidase [Paenacidovorax monticola]|uniref:N-methyl-L-tryptophan oxidase n=1 Tax=Paenacidovorax monticola TaxID=1926868 RepID=A0A7H0HBY6_9BURK|nr:N-methyl-L-tryptophan oxidase [Paenacidovorax monticola]QNP58052.1 N-methyl-L-tryptophan oxidase [Paenacidovorax monticola]
MSAASAPSYDTIVIGLGALGAASALQLARRGQRVLGIDRHHPPHDQGSSHGDSRITRLAVGEGAAYVPLVQRSHALWREIEAHTGAQLLTQTGGLILASRDCVAAHHGKADFVRTTMATARRFGIAHEVLRADEIRARFPQFLLRGDEEAYFEPEAGFVRPEAAIAAQLQWAAELGARLRTGETVTRIEPLGTHEGAGVRVHTDQGSYLAARVVLAAGPWVPGLLGAADDAGARAWGAQLRVLRQTLYWFDTGANAAQYQPERFPIFIWIFGEREEDYMYGFPTTDAPWPALKVATEQYAHTTTPERMERSVSDAEVRAMFESRLRGRFAGLDAQQGRVLKAAACLYTVTPDRDFLVDRLPGAPQVLLVSACSGHGFKHSAGLGDAIAEAITRPDAASPLLAPFAHARLDGAGPALAG